MLPTEEEIVELLCSTPCKPDGDHYICSENIVGYCPEGGDHMPLLLVRNLDYEGRNADIKFESGEIKMELRRSGDFEPLAKFSRSTAVQCSKNSIFVGFRSKVGTAGGRLQVKDDPSKEYLLSVRHVLAPQGGVGKEVLACKCEKKVATVGSLLDLMDGCGVQCLNEHEADVASLEEPDCLEFTDHSGNPGSVYKEQRIFKPTAVTRSRQGVVLSTGCYVKILSFPTRVFRNQVVIVDLDPRTPFCGGGDSGVLLLSAAAPKGDPVAILSWRSDASSGRAYSVASPLTSVLQSIEKKYGKMRFVA